MERKEEYILIVYNFKEKGITLYTNLYELSIEKALETAKKKFPNNKVEVF